MTSKYDLETIELPSKWKPSPLFAGGLILVVIGALFGVFAKGQGATADSELRFMSHSYLANFMFIMTIALGSLFFILVQFVARAGWSTSIRRIAELIMSTIPFLTLLFLPIIFALFAGKNIPYEWNVPEEVHSSVVKAKIDVGYLTKEWFFIRSIVYFGLWSLMAYFFFSQSRKQDESGDVEHSIARQKWSGPCIMIFALSVSFAAFDWVMSIDADWYSTIFGVYVFAAGMMAFFATMILICMALQNAGKLRSFVTVEHFHDMGKFMFGFIMFWSYIAFSQLLLYWYGNIPEETYWFAVRLKDGWQYVAYALIPLHFAIPFLGTISRHVRRHRLGLTFWAVWALVVHWLDMTFLVMPNAGPANVVALFGHLLGGVGMFAILMAFFLVRAKSAPLVPMKDPRLPEALTYANPIL
ncbi:MAG: quinol:cytochrome C oxidoreductase [Planctomycetaceae bacterium]|jgi:hypothetical protein|nr:quinol:cytochrome C oxidoreductase [Planctomycetaceae bacterium]